MLRLCLTVSVLFGRQIAAKEEYHEGIDFCGDYGCPQPIEMIQFNNYDEMEYLPVQWIVTEVNGMDIKSALATGLDKLQNYSWFLNAADTIVPVSAPWGLQGYLVNGTIQQKFGVFVVLVPELTSPPEPTDPTIKIGMSHIGWFYVRTFDTKVDDQQYEGRVIEFLNDLEKDKQSFDRSFFYLVFFNTNGLMEVAFNKIGE
uniref:heme-binding protein 2-like n=1 Tax=Pristiophorus japonicus TaxID=55135 RepID=UPI00398ED567